MLYEVLKYLNVLKYGIGDLVKDVVRGEFTIDGGSITNVNGVKSGMYIVIDGSDLNDGAYRVVSVDGGNVITEQPLIDETFVGTVYYIRHNAEFMALVESIGADGSANPSEYVSESFGGYSYTRATDASGSPAGWRLKYRKQLDRWRKV